MATHLLVWNPDRWLWNSLPDLLRGFMQGRPVLTRWSCGTNRRIRPQDRVFLLRLNRYPMGIFASGRVTRGPHFAPDLVAQDSGRSGRELFVEVRFDMLTDPDREMPLDRRALSQGALGKFRWEQGVSGHTLPEPIAEELEAAWAAHFGTAVAAEAPVEPAQAPPAAATPADDREAERYQALFAHYLTMLEAGVRGQVLKQAEHFSALMDAYGEFSEVVIRRAYADVSAVLLQCGLPFLDVYPPAPQPRRELRRHLIRYLDGARERLERIWLGEQAVRGVRVADELIDLLGSWAPPPLDEEFRVDAFLAGRARFPTFGGFQRREEQFAALRDAGCRFALAFERARLKSEHKSALAKHVKLLRADLRADSGFDLISFEADATERYIRVEPTQYSRRFPFLVEPRTLVASYRHGERFCIYRVFHFCWDAKLYMVRGDLRERLHFLPRGHGPAVPAAEKAAQE
ncbi:MAG TPA: DUF3883 domain-containing protein [Gammaproteobacteria bacterium]|jgi:hypothetical protein|nr:DUF3883 domain-containing protein [Gammaproteobacteria bacterium]